MSGQVFLGWKKINLQFKGSKLIKQPKYSIYSHLLHLNVLEFTLTRPITVFYWSMEVKIGSKSSVYYILGIYWKEGLNKCILQHCNCLQNCDIVFTVTLHTQISIYHDCHATHLGKLMITQ